VFSPDSAPWQTIRSSHFLPSIHITRAFFRGQGGDFWSLNEAPASSNPFERGKMADGSLVTSVLEFWAYLVRTAFSDKPIGH
jgi:hypothetical protein